MTRPETRIQQKNRAVILSAGLDVFSQFGFRGTTLDQIADAAGLSKPNLLYYFPSKEAIYDALLQNLLQTWLDPLIAMRGEGDPTDEILAYVHRKLDMARDFPRESRLFANEIIQGAPRLGELLKTDLRVLVDEKSAIIQAWSDAGRIANIDPRHLLFSIWSLTQHYADFDVQVRAVTGKDDLFDDARKHLDQTFRAMLRVA